VHLAEFQRRLKTSYASLMSRTTVVQAPAEATETLVAAIGNDAVHADTITMMLSLSFFFDTIDRMQGLMTTLNRFSRVGTVFLVTYMSGERLRSAVAGVPVIAGRRRLTLPDTNVCIDLAEAPVTSEASPRVYVHFKGTIVEDQTEWVVDETAWMQAMRRAGWEQTHTAAWGAPDSLNPTERIVSDLYIEEVWVRRRKDDQDELEPGSAKASSIPSSPSASVAWDAISETSTKEVLRSFLGSHGIQTTTRMTREHLYEQAKAVTARRPSSSSPSPAASNAAAAAVPPQQPPSVPVKTTKTTKPLKAPIQTVAAAAPPLVETLQRRGESSGDVQIRPADAFMDADETYLVHPVNAAGKTATSLTEAVFTRYPYADMYTARKTEGRTDIASLGKAVVKGDGMAQRYVVGLVVQVATGKSGGKDDTAADRDQYFQRALDDLKTQVPSEASLAFGGITGKYVPMVEAFARSVPNKVVIYK
jgi:hypothetical protein